LDTPHMMAEEPSPTRGPIGFYTTLHLPDLAGPVRRRLPREIYWLACVHALNSADIVASRM